MSHLIQPPFWRIFLISPGFFPRGNAQNLEKNPIFWTKAPPPKGRQFEENDMNFTLFDPSRWRKCLATELRIRPFLLVGDSLFSALKCGQKSNIFLDFWALRSDPEITSLVARGTPSSVFLLSEADPVGSENVREAISGSELNAQKSGKLADF